MLIRQGRKAEEKGAQPAEFDEQDEQGHDEDAGLEHEAHHVGGQGRGLAVDEQAEGAERAADQSLEVAQVRVDAEFGEHRTDPAEQRAVLQLLLEHGEQIVPDGQLDDRRDLGHDGGDEGEQRHEHAQGDERADEPGGQPRSDPAAEPQVERVEDAGQKKGEEDLVPERPEHQPEHAQRAEEGEGEGAAVQRGGGGAHGDRWFSLFGGAARPFAGNDAHCTKRRWIAPVESSGRVAAPFLHAVPHFSCFLR